MQARYLFIGFLMGFVGGGSTLLPAFRIPVYPIGNFGIIFYTILTTYAILRHRLMDIEVAIKRTLVFTMLFSIVFGVFVGITLLTQELIVEGRLLGLAISSLVIILIVRPLEDILVRITDKYLSQKEYDRQQLLKEVSRDIIGKTELNDLRDYISSTLSEKIKPEKLSIIDHDDLLSEWHGENRSPLSYDMVDNVAKRGEGIRLKDRMKGLGASLSVPIYSKDELFWILLLGDKRSGRAYLDEDIDMLEALSHQISIAIENIINFQELKRSQMEKLKFVSILVRGLAHEIFNPLTPLMHRIEDLEGEALLNIYDIYEKNKSKLEREDELKFKESILSLRESTKSLKNNASHIHLIVDTLNKLEKGDEKAIGPIDIKSFLQETVALFGLEIDSDLQKGIVIDQEIEQDLPPVDANPTLLKQILVNMFKNSCYAMKDSPDKRIHIVCRMDRPDKLMIEFSDTGPGIHQAILPKIFTHGFTTKGASGSGIGLSQCKAIIERFGGDIHVESKEGEGARFVMRLPTNSEDLQIIKK